MSFRSKLVQWMVLAAVIVGAVTGANLLQPEQVARAVSPLQLPQNFVDERVVTGLLAPRAFAFAPDGRLFILERGSASSNDINFASVRVFKNGLLLPARALTLNVCGDGERGLLGIALDPGFASNGYVYLYYTRQKLQGQSGETCGYNKYINNQPGARNRVSRFTTSGDTIDPASERVLIDNIATDTGIHNAGDLHFGADGYLYISVGDSGLTPSPAQYNTNLNGKILRILPTNSGPRGYFTTGNPFHSAPNAQYCNAGNNTTVPVTGPGTKPCREVFAFGLRNPFRFTIRPGTSTPFVGDVGGGAWEEVNEILPGGKNYGWPACEGACNPPDAARTNPIYAYAHPSTPPKDAAIIGGGFYTGATFPLQYQGGYFFADFAQGWIHYLTYNNANQTWSSNNFATGGAGLVGLKFGPDNVGTPGEALYYLAFTSESRVNGENELRRVRYQPAANQPPYGRASVNPTGSQSLSTVYTFSAAGSGDPDGPLPLTYQWSFGDGGNTTTTALTTTHQYALAGSKVVTLTVMDSGAPPLTSQPVTLIVFPGNDPPTASIVLTNTTAPGRAEYYAGDQWGFGAVNIADDTPPVSLAWEVVFHHREHQHPFLPTASQGLTGTFTIPAIWETDPMVWFRVYLRLTDTQGQVTTLYRDVYPHLTNLSLQTAPPGGQVQFEGTDYVTPLYVSRVTGIQLSLSAPSSQIINGENCMFVNWSPGGRQSQTFAAPLNSTTYTANYTACPYKLFLPIIRTAP